MIVARVVLPEARRAVEQDVIRRLSPPPGRRQQDGQVRLDLALADVLVERPRSEGAFDHEVGVVLEVRREDVREVVGHRAESSMRESISHACSQCAEVPLPD